MAAAQTKNDELTAIKELNNAVVRKKITGKAKDAKPSLLELTVAKYLVELEVDKELVADLRDLSISSAKEIDTGKGKAVVIFVPYRLHKKFQKIQSRLIRELEKKFGNKHVLFVAERQIMSKAVARQKGGSLPRSRTLTAVHSAILNDIVYPVQVVGQRTRVHLDGSKLLKIYLDPKDAKEVDVKLHTFAEVYRKLTSKNAEFLFPVQE